MLTCLDEQNWAVDGRAGHYGVFGVKQQILPTDLPSFTSIRRFPPSFIQNRCLSALLAQQRNAKKPADAQLAEGTGCSASPK
jgi:hypothetical protein